MVVTPARRRWNRAVKLVSIFLGWVTCTLCMPAFSSICCVYMLILFAFDRCFNAETPGRSSTWIRSLLSELYDTGLTRGCFVLLPILDFESDVLCFVDHMNQLLQLSCSSSKMTFYLSGTLPSQVLGRWMNARWCSFVSRYVHCTSLAPKEGHHCSLNILAEKFKTYICLR